MQVIINIKLKMFRREIKKQFNENKYNVLTAKGMLT